MKLGRLSTSSTFPPLCVAEGAGLKIIKVGHLAPFKVFSKDRFGEDVTIGKKNTIICFIVFEIKS